MQVNTASADVNLLDELSVDAKTDEEEDAGKKSQGDLAARVAAMEVQLNRIAELQVGAALMLQPCQKLLASVVCLCDRQHMLLKHLTKVQEPAKIMHAHGDAVRCSQHPGT